MHDRDKGDIEQILRMDSSGRRKRRQIWTALLSIAFASVLLLWYIFSSKGEKNVRYITQQAKRGNLTVTVSATGNLEATNQVDVGVEVSGTIEKIYVDFNDHVKKGQVLAVLDISKLRGEMLQAKATLEAALANVSKAKARLMQTKSKLSQVRQAYFLSKGKVPSQVEMDLAEANYKMAEADLEGARAKVSEARALLAVRQTNLSKAVIHSPINGIVLSRHVEEGQTVAASLKTPVLFTLAEDLKQMELHVDVDEADVGKVKKGQQATFSVDAYPDRSFPARVTEVRFSAKTVEGVVTYETILSVDNSDLSLRPGMTATADIVVNRIKDSLLIPNAALRFVPPKEELSRKKRRGLLDAILPHHPGKPSSEEKENFSVTGHNRTVWILKNGAPAPIPVIIGLTDGKMTQVIKGDIRPGMHLLTDFVIAGK